MKKSKVYDYLWLFMDVKRLFDNLFDLYERSILSVSEMAAIVWGNDPSEIKFIVVQSEDLDSLDLEDVIIKL